MSEKNLAQMQDVDYKRKIKSKVYNTALKELEQLTKGHSKGKDTYYTDF